MPELGKATYKIEIDASDFDRGLIAEERKAAAFSKKTNENLQKTNTGFKEVDQSISKMRQNLTGMDKDTDNIFKRMLSKMTNFHRAHDTGVDKSVRKLGELQAMLKTVEHEIEKKKEFDVDTGMAMEKQRLLRNSIQETNRVLARSKLEQAGFGGLGGGGSSASKFGSTPGGGGIPWKAAGIGALAPVVPAIGPLIGSAGAGALGFGALAAGGIGAMGVGLSGILATAIPAASAIKKVSTASTALDTAVRKYGAGSKQAIAAQKELTRVQKDAAPGTLKLVKSWENLGDTWHKKSMPAQKELMKILNQLTGTAKDLLPTLAKVSKISLDGLAKGLAPLEKMVKTPEFKGLLTDLAHTFAQLMPPVMKAVSNMLLIFMRIAVAVSPHLIQMANSFKDLTDKWAKGTSDGHKLKKVIDGLVSQFDSWWKLLKATGKLLFDLFGSGAKQGQKMVDSLTRILKKWDAWINTSGGQKKMHDFWKHSIDLLAAYFKILGPISVLMLKLLQALMPGLVIAVKGVAAVLGPVIKGVKWIINALPGFTKGIGALVIGAAVLRSWAKLKTLVMGVAAAQGAGGVPKAAGGGRALGLVEKFGTGLGLSGGAATAVPLAVGAAAFGGGILLGRELRRPKWDPAKDIVNKEIGATTKQSHTFASRQDSAGIDRLRSHLEGLRAVLVKMHKPTAELDKQIKSLGQTAHNVGVNTVNKLKQGINSAKFGTEPAIFGRLTKSFQKLSPDARRYGAASMVELSHAMEKNGRLPKGATDKLIKDIENKYPQLKPYLREIGYSSNEQFARTFRDGKVVKAVGDQVDLMHKHWIDAPKLAKTTAANTRENWLKEMAFLRTKLHTGSQEQQRQAKIDLDRLLKLNGDSARQLRHQWQTIGGAMGKDVGDIYSKMSATSRGSLNEIATATNNALTAIGAQKLGFSVAKIAAKTKATGGYVGQPGEMGGDTVPLFLPPAAAVFTGHQMRALGLSGGGLVPTMVGRGEYVAHPDEIPGFQAQAQARGFGGLGGLFSTVNRPNYLAKGGAVGGSHAARLMAAANRVSAAHFPYRWGGGHEQPSHFEPFDCSGAVSYVTQQAGYKVPTTVAGGMGSWGFPKGGGAATIFYNGGHTFMRIGGRYWGTSGFARPGGGAGWFNQSPGAGYLSGFRQVHLPDIAGLGQAGMFGEIKAPHITGKMPLVQIPRGASKKFAAGANKYVEKQFEKLNPGGGQALEGASFSGGSLAIAKALLRAWKVGGHNNRKALLSEFETVLVESGGMNNPAGGDRDSIGSFQQRASWGSAASRHNPYESALRFLARWHDVGSAGQSAQRVQVSQFPARYDQAEGAARGWLHRVGAPGFARGGFVGAATGRAPFATGGHRQHGSHGRKFTQREILSLPFKFKDIPDITKITDKFTNHQKLLDTQEGLLERLDSRHIQKDGEAQTLAGTSNPTPFSILDSFDLPRLQPTFSQGMPHFTVGSRILDDEAFNRQFMINSLVGEVKGLTHGVGTIDKATKERKSRVRRIRAFLHHQLKRLLTLQQDMKDLTSKDQRIRLNAATSAARASGRAADARRTIDHLRGLISDEESKGKHKDTGKIAAWRKQISKEEIFIRKQKPSSTKLWAAHLPIIKSNINDAEAPLKKDLSDMGGATDHVGTGGMIGRILGDISTLTASRKGLSQTIIDLKTGDIPNMRLNLQDIIDAGAAKPGAGAGAGPDQSELVGLLQSQITDLQRALQVTSLQSPIWQAFAGANPGLWKGSNFVGSFALGTPYVPETGMAQVHKGEAIIPSSQNPYTHGFGELHLHGDLAEFTTRVEQVVDGKTDDITHKVNTKLARNMTGRRLLPTTR